MRATSGSRSLLIDSRMVEVHAPPSKAFAPVRRIGGTTGWYYADWLWQVRGVLDRMMGGIGMRRGRRDPDQLAVGDTVDCMRVERFQPDRLLRLAFEMRIPGRAWLEFEVNRNGSGTTIRQTAIYEPGGVIGRLYWYLTYPAHRLVFAGMIRRIAAAGVRLAAEREETPSAFL